MKTSLALPILVSLAPLCAFAHVTVDPQTATAGRYAKLVFRVPHGCDGSATTKIRVQIPDGVLSVKPQVHPGWKIATKTRKLPTPAELHGKKIAESTAEVIWSGGPLPDEYMDEFGMSVKFPEGATKLTFEIDQDCRKGTVHWSPTVELKADSAN